MFTSGHLYLRYLYAMALYMEAKKLQMTRDDINNIILRVGEPHVVMTQLRTIAWCLHREQWY